MGDPGTPTAAAGGFRDRSGGIDGVDGALALDPKASG